jgi:hypothetical protein
MNTYSNKEEDYKKKAFLTQKSSTKGLDSSSPDIVDNRPEVLFQRKLQEKADSSTVVNETSQLQAIADNFIYQNQPLQRKENTTGLPDDLKSGIENLSGYSMDDVKVHRNSDKPKQLQAHAYAQGTEIHLGSGQEKHLPHEAWHVVQQKQGRVKPTTQLAGGAQINDNDSLENEATKMGNKASTQVNSNGKTAQRQSIIDTSSRNSISIQLDPESDPTELKDIDAGVAESTNDIVDFSVGSGLLAAGNDKIFGGEDKKTGDWDAKTPGGETGAQNAMAATDLAASAAGFAMQTFKLMQAGAKAADSGDPVDYADATVEGLNTIHNYAGLAIKMTNTPETVGLMPGIGDGLSLLSAGVALYRDRRAQKAINKIKTGAESLTPAEEEVVSEYGRRVGNKMIEDGVEVAWSIAQLVGLAFPGANAGIAFIHKGVNLLKAGAFKIKAYFVGKKDKAAKRLEVGQGGSGISEGEKKRLETVEQMVKNSGGKHVDFVRLLRLHEEKTNLEEELSNTTDEEAKKLIKQKQLLAQSALYEKLNKYNSLFGAGGSVCDGKNIGENEVIMAKQFFLNMVKNMKDDVLKAAESRIKRFKHFISFHRLEKKIDHVGIFKNLYGDDGESNPEKIAILEAFENDPDGAYLDDKLQSALNAAKNYTVRDVSNEDLEKTLVDKIKNHTELYDHFKSLDGEIFNDGDMKDGSVVKADKFAAGMEKYLKRINPF